MARSADRFVHLCRPVELAAPVSLARCRVTADGRYALFVNGVELGRGPVRSDPSHLHYDSYHVDRLLRPGRNVVAALVRHYGQSVAHWKPAAAVGSLGQGGLLFELELQHGGNEELVASDESWFVWTSGYELSGGGRWGGWPKAEIANGSLLPPGWPAPDLAVAAWQEAVVCRPEGLGIRDPHPPAIPFEEIRPRPIQYLTCRDAEPTRTVAVLSGADGADEGPTVTVDFGRIVNGHPILEVRATAGTVIDLAGGEDLGADLRPVVAPRNWTMRYTAAGDGDETFESFEPVGLRYLALTVRSGTLLDHRLVARERLLLRTGNATFSCSDPDLTELWHVGAQTLDLCSTDAFVDCPGRENRAWLGDAYIHTLLTFVTGSDWSLARWNLQLHAQAPRPGGLLPMVAAGDYSELATTIPDYTLHWIRTLARWWEYTADDKLVRELLPLAVRGLQFFERHRGADGPIGDLPGWVFLDWAQTGRDHYLAALDALLALTAADVAGMARAVGDRGTADWADGCATRSRQGMALYWDPQREAFVDSADVNGVPGRRISQHTNALAVLAGVVPPGRVAAVLNRILDEDRLVTTLTPAEPGPDAERLSRHWLPPPGFDDEKHVVRAQPFFSHFIHQAVAQAGWSYLIPSLLRRWLPLVRRGNGCLEEYWDAAPGTGSRAHAWSATPTYDLTTHVLGVKPATPGGDVIRLSPSLGDLDWAEGVVPTRRGDLVVRVGKSGVEELVVPDGVVVQIPDAGDAGVFTARRHRGIALPGLRNGGEL